MVRGPLDQIRKPEASDHCFLSTPKNTSVETVRWQEDPEGACSVIIIQAEKKQKLNHVQYQLLRETKQKESLFSDSRSKYIK